MRRRSAPRAWPAAPAFQSSGIDPSGEHVFRRLLRRRSSATRLLPSDLRYFDDPLGRLPWDDVAVLIEPRETVAPVGSEVVLIAGVVGPDGYLRTNRRLEWSIAPGSVGPVRGRRKGHGFCDLLLGDFNWPRIVNATFAIGSTSRSNIRLNRGTCTPENDVFVLRGQGWITLTSPVEGTSHVTVVAPEVYSWDARIKSATVHWVDAVVQYPPPAINPAGTKHVFTTTVTRHSNQSPCENWRVRYEIVGGPPAGFSPAGATVDRSPHQLRRPGLRRNRSEAAGVRHEQDLHSGDPAGRRARRRRPEAGRRQRHDDEDVDGGRSGGSRDRSGDRGRRRDADLPDRGLQSRRSAGQGRGGNRRRARRADATSAAIRRRKSPAGSFAGGSAISAPGSGGRSKSISAPRSRAAR